MTWISAARVVAAVSLSLAASATAGAQDRAVRAQDKAPLLSDSSQWVSVLRQGRELPPWERLAILTPDGHPIRIVNGDTTRVLLPVEIHAALASGALKATLVHNHVVSRGFSCADLRQLAAPGVERVVVVGNDGGVFEASAGTRFRTGVLEDSFCAAWFDRVASAIAFDGSAVGSSSELADQIPHLFAAALFASDVIDYRIAPAAPVRITHFRNHATFDRVVTRIAGELQHEMNAPARRVTDDTTGVSSPRRVPVSPPRDSR